MAYFAVCIFNHGNFWFSKFREYICGQILAQHGLVSYHFKALLTRNKYRL